VASAKIQGSNFAPEPPRLYETFIEVLNEKPSFVAIVVNAPIGFRDRPRGGGRTCDVEARALVGLRGSSIHNAPTRAVLDGSIAWRDGGLDAITATMLPRYREVAAEMSPFRQRVVYEGHPELSFYQLNKDTPLHRSKQIEMGREERKAILKEKLPGIEKVIEADIPSVPQKHLFDAAALLWTARRVYGRAAKRLPADAEWDSEGIRMEIVY
jgi:predicted RNase H-like nuclease